MTLTHYPPRSLPSSININHFYQINNKEKYRRLKLYLELKQDDFSFCLLLNCEFDESLIVNVSKIK